jgi:hypothetical protein
MAARGVKVCQLCGEPHPGAGYAHPGCKKALREMLAILTHEVPRPTAAARREARMLARTALITRGEPRA